MSHLSQKIADAILLYAIDDLEQDIGFAPVERKLARNDALSSAFAYRPVCKSFDNTFRNIIFTSRISRVQILCPRLEKKSNPGTTQAKTRGTGISYVLAIAIAIGIRQDRNIRYKSKQ